MRVMNWVKKQHEAEHFASIIKAEANKIVRFAR